MGTRPPSTSGGTSTAYTTSPSAAARTGATELDDWIVEVHRARLWIAQDQLDAEEIRFSAGAATSFDVLRFQRELTDMRTRELVATIDYNRAWSALRVAEGLALEKYDIEFE